jgi:hypothetical protein
MPKKGGTDGIRLRQACSATGSMGLMGLMGPLRRGERQALQTELLVPGAQERPELGHI